MRKLTSIRKIDKIVPHKNADLLEVAIVGGWPCVVRKGEFAEGQVVVFCEVDTLLPPHEAYDFLAKGCGHTEPDGSVWYRLKTVRLRGQLSQGILLPLSVLKDFAPEDPAPCDPVLGGPNWITLLFDLECYEQDGHDLDDWIGVSLNEFLGVRKYEKPLAPNLSGTAKGTFPFFISKTDEERIQNLDTDEFAGLRFHRSEKLDGSSCTVYCHNGQVGVCSRNLELVENPDNTFWKVARESGAIDAVQMTTTRSLAIQGEVVGPGIQGNPYKLAKHEFFAFNLFDITSGTYVRKDQFLDFCRAHNIQTVPILEDDFCPEDIQEILADAEGCSQLNTEVEREGVVWVNDKHGVRFSFKAISNKFLLKNDG